MFDAELIDRLTDEYLFDLPKTKYQIAEQFE